MEEAKQGSSKTGNTIRSEIADGGRSAKGEALEKERGKNSFWGDERGLLNDQFGRSISNGNRIGYRRNTMFNVDRDGGVCCDEIKR